MLAALLVAACGGGETADDEAEAAVSSTGDAATVEADPAAAPSATLAPGAPGTVEDSIRLHEDSLYELSNLRTRQASMESYASCMAKARQLDPQTRPVIEAACQRARGAPAAAPPR